MQSPLGLLFYKLHPNALSLSSQYRTFSPFTSFVAHLWMLPLGWADRVVSHAPQHRFVPLAARAHHWLTLSLLPPASPGLLLLNCSPATCPICAQPRHCSIPAQHPALSFAELDASAPICPDPSARPLLPPGSQRHSWLSIISKLPKDAFHTCIQVIDRNVEQDWP